MKKLNIKSVIITLLLTFTSVSAAMSQQHSHNFLYPETNEGLQIVAISSNVTQIENTHDGLYEANQSGIQIEKKLKTVPFQKVSRKELDKPGYDRYGNLITARARKNMRDALTRELNEQKSKNKSQLSDKQTDSNK